MQGRHLPKIFCEFVVKTNIQNDSQQRSTLVEPNDRNWQTANRSCFYQKSIAALAVRSGQLLTVLVFFFNCTTWAYSKPYTRFKSSRIIFEDIYESPIHSNGKFNSKWDWCTICFYDSSYNRSTECINSSGRSEFFSYPH